MRPATLADADLLGEVLADAFTEDPVFLWLIPATVESRDERLRAFFASMSRTYLRQGKPCHVAGDGSAAALWAEPGEWALSPAELAVEAEPQIAAFSGRLEEALGLQIQIESLHPHDPPHWYLGYLGARTASQGQGLGSELLREVLTKADAQGVPAYLESSNERNLSLYRRHGFEVVGEIQTAADGPTIWRMWRDPAKG